MNYINEFHYIHFNLSSIGKIIFWNIYKKEKEIYDNMEATSN